MENKEISKSTIRKVLIMVAFLWGLNPTIVKIGLENMPTLPYTTLRLFSSVIVFLIILYASKTYKKVDKKDYSKFLLNAGGALGYQIAFIFGVKYTTAATASILIALSPISVLIINKIFKNITINSNMIKGIIITILGIILVTIDFTGNYFQNNNLSNYFGIFLILFSQFSAAIYTVFSKDLLQTYSHYQVSAYIFIITFIGTLIISGHELIYFNFSIIPWKAWASIIYGGVFSLCIANNLWIWGVKHIGSNETAIYHNLPPIFALLSGMLLLNEMPVITQVFGMVIIIIGIYIFNLKEKVA